MNEQKAAEPAAQMTEQTCWRADTFLMSDGRRITRLREITFGIHEDPPHPKTRYRGHAALQGPGGEPGPDYEFEIVAPSLEEAFTAFAARAQEAGKEVVERLEATMRRRLLQNPGVGLKHIDPRLKDLRGGRRRA